LWKFFICAQELKRNRLKQQSLVERLRDILVVSNAGSYKSGVHARLNDASRDITLNSREFQDPRDTIFKVVVFVAIHYFDFVSQKWNSICDHVLDPDVIGVVGDVSSCISFSKLWISALNGVRAV